MFRQEYFFSILKNPFGETFTFFFFPSMGIVVTASAVGASNMLTYCDHGRKTDLCLVLFSKVCLAL